MVDVVFKILSGYFFGALVVAVVVVAIEFFILLPVGLFQEMKRGKDSATDRFFGHPHFMKICFWAWLVIGTIIAIGSLLGFDWSVLFM